MPTSLHQSGFPSVQTGMGFLGWKYAAADAAEKDIDKIEQYLLKQIKNLKPL